MGSETKFLDFLQNEKEAKELEENLREAEEKYNVFHIVCEQGHTSSPSVIRQWKEVLGNRVLLLNDYDMISEVITSAIQVNEGADVEEVIASWPTGEIRQAVRHALFGVEEY